ncbi:MAG: hypothetical protein GYB68_18390 [Chloroflexi bacterium]|nr:hypothetical protein [Chloroflexota bacterium]
MPKPDDQTPVQVGGPFALTILNSLDRPQEPAITARGWDRLAQESWIEQAALIKLMDDLSRNRQDAVNLVTVGLRSADQFPFPSEVDAVEVALALLNEVYQAGHRPTDPAVGWTLSIADPNEIILLSTTPYPADWEYGLIFGLTSRFRLTGQQFAVYQRPLGPQEQRYRVVLTPRT